MQELRILDHPVAERSDMSSPAERVSAVAAAQTESEGRWRRHRTRGALDQQWRRTRIQRCYFHIRATVIRHTTLNPRLEAGKKVLALTRASGGFSAAATPERRGVATTNRFRQVKDSTSIHDADAVFTAPAPAGKKGCPASSPSYQSPPVQAADYGTALRTEAFEQVSWRQGAKGGITAASPPAGSARPTGSY